MAGKRKNAKKEKQKDQRPQSEKNLEQGISIFKGHPLFSRLKGYVTIEDNRRMGKGTAYKVSGSGWISLNRDSLLSPGQWAYILAHCHLHLAFRHFDAEKMPGYAAEDEEEKKQWIVDCDKQLWNLACDVFIAKFLMDIKFGEPVEEYPFLQEIGTLADEQRIYEYLAETGKGNSIPYHMDMEDLEHPLRYQRGRDGGNTYALYFAHALADSASQAVGLAGGNKGKAGGYLTPAGKAAQWFINRYPLLGGLASAFQIIDDYEVCIREEIQIAAVDAELGEIYVNPAAGLDSEELRFVLAHEYLHAGLQHHLRCQGRDPYLWNAACDFVINGWLAEMEIGKLPEQGLLYDERLSGLSAESIYDMLLTDMKKYLTSGTFRGYGKGDILRDRARGRGGGGTGKVQKSGEGMTMDEFCRRALAQGLSYHQSSRRGLVPAGLIEEIRALAMPPVPWDVELARWFEKYFPSLEPKRTYARPSRRQGATPDIPRPRYVKDEYKENARTFGVVLDTSGSMTAKMIGKALGSIASYAAAREVPYARVVFCDARAYDAGYLAPEDIAGRVEVKGRGGTKLQPAVDLLEHAKDFPKNGPILIITDGEIEDKLHIRREHAFLMPKGKRIPFRTKGEVFYFE
ncbi:MAG: hypothetical protein HFH13_06970 [Dorea sp.]|nr:hypothetical protein [Dorea sp.]